MSMQQDCSLPSEYSKGRKDVQLIHLVLTTMERAVMKLNSIQGPTLISTVSSFSITEQTERRAAIELEKLQVVFTCLWSRTGSC